MSVETVTLAISSEHATRSSLHADAGPQHAPGFQRLNHVAIVVRTEIAVAGRDQVRRDGGLRIAQPAVARLQLDKVDLAMRAEKYQVGPAWRDAHPFQPPCGVEPRVLTAGLFLGRCWQDGH
jgi:hypothetical protein